MKITLFQLFVFAFGFYSTTLPYEASFFESAKALPELHPNHVFLPQKAQDLPVDKLWELCERLRDDGDYFIKISKWRWMRTLVHYCNVRINL